VREGGDGVRSGGGGECVKSVCETEVGQCGVSARVVGGNVGCGRVVPSSSS
jgi:hypothetical protein